VKRIPSQRPVCTSTSPEERLRTWRNSRYADRICAGRRRAGRTGGSIRRKAPGALGTLRFLAKGVRDEGMIAKYGQAARTRSKLQSIDSPCRIGRAVSSVSVTLAGGSRDSLPSGRNNGDFRELPAEYQPMKNRGASRRAAPSMPVTSDLDLDPFSFLLGVLYVFRSSAPGSLEKTFLHREQRSCGFLCQSCVFRTFGIAMKKPK